ncbi:DUF418 domain-containing protein [Polyangium aurulentum]|uniref:DUF418 domain-containing protein n=1 Tax=Polyangium aurulentum TaxID=2567896 RepID=UPI0010ADCA08|nr:DUF418 domain-containing protein [Polyangium aurulentum]UQA60040.1 DUF418 domain-containing protein [Polyangium aurulentum]
MAQAPPPTDRSTSLAPVSPEERLPLLDVLRGFALLGIIVMNMPSFNLPWGSWAIVPHLFPGPADRAAETVAMAIFAGKANSIFSFLFGLGLTIQLQRADARGQRMTPLYLRRLAVLFTIGMAHSLLLWNGDVLHMYALLGLVLLAVRRASDRVILGLIGFTLLFPVARSAFALWMNEPPQHSPSYFIAVAHEHMRIFREGSYAEQVGARIDVQADWYSGTFRLQGAIIEYARFAATMLLGFYVGRNRILENVAANAALIRKAMWWGLGLGVAASAGFSLLLALRDRPPEGPTLSGFFLGLCFNANRPLLCVGYIGAIALLLQKDRFRRVLLVFEAPGRMPLTNYLTQSLIATTLFNSYGFALFGRVGPLLGLLISVAIFAVQIVWSRWWLARFRFGPLEWLWRAATYGTLPAIRLRPELGAVRSPAAGPAGGE